MSESEDWKANCDEVTIGLGMTENSNEEWGEGRGRETDTGRRKRWGGRGDEGGVKG